MAQDIVLVHITFAAYVVVYPVLPVIAREKLRKGLYWLTWLSNDDREPVSSHRCHKRIDFIRSEIENGFAS